MAALSDLWWVSGCVEVDLAVTHIKVSDFHSFNFFRYYVAFCLHITHNYNCAVNKPSIQRETWERKLNEEKFMQCKMWK